MKVIEHYQKADGPLISFEIIPPKRGSSVQQIFESLDEVMRFRPPFIDVTSHAAEAYYEELPNGTVKKHIKRKRPGTIGLCAAIKHRYGADPVPHVICRGFTKEETEDALIELHYLGIDNVLAIRGDNAAPKPVAPDRSVNPYAIDLVRQIKRMNQGIYLEDLIDAQATDFCVGVGGYPEKHFEAPNLDWDIRKLKEKVDAGADYIVTQMFFDNSAYFNFVDKCRAADISVPIVPGLKVITRASNLSSVPRTFFVNLPEELTVELTNSPDKAERIGIEWCKKQSSELLDGGAPGLHFYIMSNPMPAVEVIESIPGLPSSKIRKATGSR